MKCICSNIQQTIFQIEVCNAEGGRSLFDSVIFTIPAPQLLEIDMDGRLTELVIQEFITIIGANKMISLKNNNTSLDKIFFRKFFGLLNMNRIIELRNPNEYN